MLQLHEPGTRVALLPSLLLGELGQLFRSWVVGTVAVRMSRLLAHGAGEGTAANAGGYAILDSLRRHESGATLL